MFHVVSCFSFKGCGSSILFCARLPDVGPNFHENKCDHINMVISQIKNTRDMNLGPLDSKLTSLPLSFHTFQHVFAKYRLKWSLKEHFTQVNFFKLCPNLGPFTQLLIGIVPQMSLKICHSVELKFFTRKSSQSLVVGCNSWAQFSRN